MASSGECNAFVTTADACDANEALLASGDLRVLQPPLFQVYGKCRVFSGPVVTVKLYENNEFAMGIVQTKGEGRVLVMDGGGSMKRAMAGGVLCGVAAKMGWSGIVVNGCIRDADQINGLEIGVRALATNPHRSGKKRIGEKHVPVYVGGTLIQEGEWLYADGDGILVSKNKLNLFLPDDPPTVESILRRCNKTACDDQCV